MFTLPAHKVYLYLLYIYYYSDLSALSMDNSTPRVCTRNYENVNELVLDRITKKLLGEKCGLFCCILTVVHREHQLQ